MDVCVTLAYFTNPVWLRFLRCFLALLDFFVAGVWVGAEKENDGFSCEKLSSCRTLELAFFTGVAKTSACLLSRLSLEGVLTGVQQSYIFPSVEKIHSHGCALGDGVLE